MAPRRPSGATAAPLIPAQPTMSALRQAAGACRACALWERATQTVFGEGIEHPSVVIVGEQPGNEEDETGRPFVGPAGRLLDRALEAAGIRRDQAYVTNAVKHFKWESRGKKRIHQKPNQTELNACWPWLEAELDLLRPRAVLCLGATASQALLGRGFKVSEQRGRLLSTPLAPLVLATVHPSSILRTPDPQMRRADMDAFVEDLRVLAKALGEQPG